jgi:hypothetical protein
VVRVAYERRGAADCGQRGEAAGAVAKCSIAVSFGRWQKGMSELGLSFKTDRQKEATWRMEFEALGEQSVLKNIKGAIYGEAKRQAAFRWLSEQAQLRDRREARNADLAWLALFVAIAAVSIGTIGLLMALR